MTGVQTCALPILPLYYGVTTYLVKDYVSGCYMTSLDFIYFHHAVVNK